MRASSADRPPAADAVAERSRPTACGVKAVDGDVMPRSRRTVDETSIDDGDDRGDAFVDGRRAPGRPAALQAAGDHELVDPELPPSSLASNSCTQSIARTARVTIGRRAGQFRRPLEELVPGVGDQVILFPGTPSCLSTSGWLGTLQLHDHGARGFSELECCRVGRFRRFSSVRPAVDAQEGEL